MWEEQQNVCWWQQLSFSSSGEGGPFLCQPSYKTLGLDSGSRCGLKCPQDLDDKQLFMFMLEVNGRGSAVWIFIKQALEGAFCTSLLCAQIISVGILWSQGQSLTFPALPLHYNTFYSLTQIETSI